MKTALVYDRVNKWGGAERVLLALHEMFPDAPLYTSVYDEKRAPWAKVFPRVIPSFLQKIPGANSRHEWLAAMMPIAFETLDFTGYDLVISVTSEAAKGVITRPPAKHVCYCLTPTRYLWSHRDEYFKGTTLKTISKPVVSYLRYWDRIAAQRPDIIISISTAVKDRVRKYYERESEVIFPPVEIEKFQIPNSPPSPRLRRASKFQIEDKDYFLIVSRLVPYKKVDLAIEAFNELGYSLVVVGTGSEENKLKSMSKNNITFRGFVSEEELVSYYQNAKALIFPQEEDFGIVAVEAQAVGAPVIAYKKGGALDTVIDPSVGSGRFATGIFFKEQTKESLIKAVKHYDDSNQRSEMSRECIKNAKKFSKERFKKEFAKLVEKYVSG